MSASITVDLKEGVGVQEEADEQEEEQAAPLAAPFKRARYSNEETKSSSNTAITNQVSN